MPKVYKKNILIKYLHYQISTWRISMSSFQFHIWRLKISDLSAFNDLIRHQGILVGPDALEFRYPYTQELMQPDWIRRRGSVPTVRILCESGVRIKILESGFGNPNPDAFALLLVQFADPDHVRIRNYLHFAFRWLFLMDPDPRIQIRVRVSPNSFGKNFNIIFKRN